MLDRVREVLSALHPEATAEQIDAAFYAHTNTTSGGMVLPSVSLAELRRDGNLRELMAAVNNTFIRTDLVPATTLDEGLARLLNQDGWEFRAAEFGLDVAALASMRASIVTDDREAVITAWDVHAERHVAPSGGEASLVDEFVRSNAVRRERPSADGRRRSLTVQDWALLGKPLSLRELQAVPGELHKLSKTRLDPGVMLPRDSRGRVDLEALEDRCRAADSSVVHVLPLYSYDGRGRRLRDDAGNAIVDGVLVYRDEGVVDPATALGLDPDRYAVPLTWLPGAAKFEFVPESEWFRQVAVERGVPLAAGISGSAARFAARFRWLRPPNIAERDFAAALLAHLVPQHHSLYETVRGLAMAGIRVVDEFLLGTEGGDVAALYDAANRLHVGET